MNGRGSIKILLIVLTLVTVISGIIVFRITDKSNKDESHIVDSNIESNGKDDISIKEAKKELESENHIYNVFDEVKNIYIQNPNIPTAFAEIYGKDKSFIVANFKSMPKISSTLEEVQRHVLDLSKYDYQINIPIKNIKIDLYSNPGYIVYQIKNDIEKIYSVNEEQMKAFIGIVQEKYIENSLARMLEDLPSKMYVSARDVNSTYILSDKEIKEIMNKFKILSLENNDKNTDIPAVYPDYNINIKKDDKEYNLSLINEDTMIIETPMVYLYCKYDKVLWDYVQSKLPVQMDFQENELEYLFKAERVIVNDMAGIYNIQNDNYYNLMIPRWLNKTDHKKVNGETQNIEEKDLRFSLKFLIEDQLKDVLIYDNYIIYGDDIYFSKNISEAIRSLLMVP